MTLDGKKFVSICYSKHVKPRFTSPTSISPPSLLDHVLTLDKQVYELQETAGRLECTHVQHTLTHWMTSLTIRLFKQSPHSNAILPNQAIHCASSEIG